MSRTASVETVNRGEHSCVHPTSKMIDPILTYFRHYDVLSRKIIEDFRQNIRGIFMKVTWKAINWNKIGSIIFGVG